MNDPVESSTKQCLNCGSNEVTNYCSNCGQKFQPTKLPLKFFLDDAAETLFNLDSRWFTTIKDLFVKPGRVTLRYIEGKRIVYLPPLRVYLTVSIVYFLLLQIIESSQVFFIDFEGSEELGEMGVVVKYSMFLLVPALGLIAQLFYRKRKAFYVEYLIFSLHIHSIWFVLFSIQLLGYGLERNYDALFTNVLVQVVDAIAQIGSFLYLILYLKNTFGSKWVSSIAKAFGIMTLYAISLVICVAVYSLIFIGIE